ncbi:cryptochrome/photolyase family protein [Plastoroseomonas arctica]|uniref:Deoxyribodipyrimidine photo-lyase n=1 Tax=Plastoroseomonas arctica TaxID=1509237 RepID=A0AAF1K419_9PROT|nr:deoxyribodipyrimidine photo-lyase [Plastoroseomonas arctica]MBR0655839.1 deoxyribodipyrimidine photo-lyase [Plastoroseomonas arctica]
MPDPAILWFRQDLRLADNPALVAAIAAGPVLPVYILDDDAAGPWAPGGAGRWWLHHSLASLGDALKATGAPLTLLRGRAETLIPALAQSVGATQVHAGRLVEPFARERDHRIAEALGAVGATLTLHTSSLIAEPHRIRSGAGTPFAVYTPFSRAIFALGEPDAPLPAPKRIAGVPPAPDSLTLDALDLLPSRDWADAFPELWTPGEDGAAARIKRFTPKALRSYGDDRNAPGIAGTSGLSPHLHWGEVSPRQVWHAAREAGAEGQDTFLKEILWREFSYHLLWHRPELPETPLRKEFERFPWKRDAKLLRAWQRGQTGYPIVDAGMRQLWTHGWMHNRVRMITASFLIKHLLQPWQDGAAWFWDTLVDADLASNSASWQWVAGSGSDAAPYFRVFNPILQGEKFDGAGAYVRRYVPELAALPDKLIQRPWEAPPELRATVDYPAPIIAHDEGRARALAAFASLKG